MNDWIAEALREEAAGAERFIRALHYRESPTPVLRGRIFARWLAVNILRVYPSIRWTRDSDWEPPKITWAEDELMPRTVTETTDE